MMAAMQAIMPFTSDVAAHLNTIVGQGGDSFSSFGTFAWPATLPTLGVFFLIMVAGASRSTPFQTLALEVVPQEERGALAAVRNSANQAGRAAGAAIGSILWASGVEDRYGTICFVSAILGVAGVLLLKRMVGEQRSE